jgi:3-oxoadipate enol-lactonase
MIMATATWNDIEIYYERGGVGEPLLFISGSGGDLRNKPNQFDSPLASHFEVIGYDQRGLGRTTNPPQPFTMQQYADDAAALLDHLQLQDIDVVGVSFGGMVAQEFALRHPSRVRRLVLACTSSGGAGGASYPLHELLELPSHERAQTQLRIADTRRTDDWIMANPQKWAKMIEMATPRKAAGLAPVLSELNDPVVDGSRVDDPLIDGPGKQLAARRWHDTFDRLPGLRMPVLLVGGEFDGIAPPENMQSMHRQIAASQLRFFAGGHLFLAQDKAAYPYIIQWLNGNI